MISQIIERPDTTLESVLLDRALQCGLQQRGVMRWDKLNEYLGIFFAIGLMAIGFVGLRWCPDSFGLKLSEALLIAGVLTLTVDPFLKRRLFREASKDIFHHLLGFNLPEPIRERLKHIVNSSDLYRKDMTMTCTFYETADGIKID